MRRHRRRATAVASLLVVAGGCGTPPDYGPSDVDRARQRLERLAERDPAAVLDAVRDANADATLVAATAPADGAPYTVDAGAGGWRVDSATGVVQEVDGEVCFDELFGARMARDLAPAYGSVELDPEPWACSPSDFGLNERYVAAYRDAEPWRHLAGLVPGGDFRAEVVADPDDPHLHVTATDDAGVPHELWVDGDLRPVRMTADGVVWTFVREVEPEPVERPPADDRGSYGYRTGPGQAAAKACQQSGTCSLDDPQWRLTWGDGRTG